MKTTPLGLHDRAATSARFFFTLATAALTFFGASAARAQAPASTADWMGSIRCEINVTAPGYSHQETQTWTLTGAPPTQQSTTAIYPATWSVTGQGWHNREHHSSRVISKWTVKAPGPNSAKSAPIAFMVTANGRLFVQLSHAQLVAEGGYTGTDQYLADGAAQPEKRLVRSLYEYQFQKIEAAATDAKITGSDTREVNMGVGPWHPGDAQVMVTITWALGRGSAPPMPPSTLPPPPPLMGGDSTPSGASPPTGSPVPSNGNPPPSSMIQAPQAMPLDSANSPSVPRRKPTASPTLPSSSPPAAPTADVAPVRPSERSGVPDTITPKDPTHFAIRQVGEGEVELHWDAVPGADKYVLHSTLAAGRTNPELSVSGTSQRINLLKPGEYEWQVSSWYAPDGARTASADWPRARVTVKAPGWYRITGAHVRIYREEPDNRPKVHGRNNEVFFSSYAQVLDRVTGAILSSDAAPANTQVHGDTNNADPEFKTLPYETRIPAGTVSPDGGIQTGDDIRIWSGTSKNLYPRHGVYTPTECVPFVFWEGKLLEGLDVVLIRPMVWLAIDRRDRGNEQFWDPYRQRVGRENSSDILHIGEISAALSSDDIAVANVPQWSTTGQWRVDQHRPFGLAVTGNFNGAPAVWTDRVVVLTKEKIDAFLSYSPRGQFEMPRVRGSMGGPNAIPMGEYSLFLKIERLD